MPCAAFFSPCRGAGQGDRYAVLHALTSKMEMLMVFSPMLSFGLIFAPTVSRTLNKLLGKPQVGILN